MIFIKAIKKEYKNKIDRYINCHVYNDEIVSYNFLKQFSNTLFHCSS